MQRLKAVVPAVLGLLVAGAAAFGQASITSVGVADPSTPYSSVRGLSADGQWATGASISKQYDQLPAAENPYVWSAGGGFVELVNPSGIDSQGRGIAIRSNAGEVIVGGMVGGIMRHYRAPLADPANGSWTANLSGNARMGNNQAVRLDSTGTYTDERWYAGGWVNSSNRAYRYRGDPAIDWDGTSGLHFNSLSGTGIGFGTAGGTARWEGPGAVAGQVTGGNGISTQGFGVSDNALWFSGLDKYDASNYEAYRAGRADTSASSAAMTLLGRLDPDNNHLSCAYAIADNGVAAGGSYGTSWTATVWDDSGTWDSTLEPKSLQALLNDAGVDTSMWTRLERVWATSNDGTVLAGDGIWADDGSTRGFVAVIPEPSAAGLLLLGGLVLLRRRR